MQTFSKSRITSNLPWTFRLMNNSLDTAKFTESFNELIDFRGHVRRSRLSEPEIRRALRWMKLRQSRYGASRLMGFNGSLNSRFEEYYNYFTPIESSIEEHGDAGLSASDPDAIHEARIARLGGYEGNYNNLDEEQVLTKNRNAQAQFDDLFFVYETALGLNQSYHDTLIYLDDNVQSPNAEDEHHNLRRRIKDADETQCGCAKPGICIHENLNYSSLRLRPLQQRELSGLEGGRRFKNNLCIFVKYDEVTETYLAVACGSAIIFYPGNSAFEVSGRPLFLLETAPLHISDSDIRAATSRENPYSINFLKTSSTWLAEETIAACIDSGHILIWRVRDLLASLKGSSRINHISSDVQTVRIAAHFDFNLGSSAWGVDFRTSRDVSGNLHHILIGSSNRRTLKLIYYNSTAERFEELESRPLGHNIPEVSIVEYHITQNSHMTRVCAASISGEIAMVKFEFNQFQTLPRGNVEISEITRTTEDCWTVKPISSIFFKEVHSLRALIGDQRIDEAKSLQRLKQESAILCQETTFIDYASGIQQFLIPSAVRKREGQIASHGIRFSDIDDEYRRYKKTLSIAMQNKELCELLKMYLAVSTLRRGALLRGDTLLCTALSQELFDIGIDSSDDLAWSDRISLSLLIPELLALVLATQAGSFTIMRLCRYEGRYAMRQECNAPLLQTLSNTLNTIVGIAARDISPLPEFPRFLLYVIYLDGLCLPFEISENEDDTFDMTSIGL